MKDVSLAVESGEVVGLLGPQRCRQDHLFYMMVGLVPLDGGSICLDDGDLSQMPMHQRARLGLSYLPQEASIFRRLSVADNIRAVLELKNYRVVKCRSTLTICCMICTSLIYVPTRPSACPAASAAGWKLPGHWQHSRVLFLLDEPFAGVDPIAVLDIQKIIHFSRERDIGVLITDHNVRETLGICDRAYIISDGTVLASGNPDEIIYNENVRKVYLGEHFRL